MSETLCETCKWWGAERAHDDASPYGSCRRHAPTIGRKEIALPYHDPDNPDVPGPIVSIGAWRWTAFDDWCGDHAAKEELA